MPAATRRDQPASTLDPAYLALATPVSRIARHCLDCGALTKHGTRCPDCDFANHTAAYGGNWRNIAKDVTSAATECYLCGLPPTPDDPFEADHVIAHANGGQSTYDNAAAAHRSCNRAKRDR